MSNASLLRRESLHGVALLLRHFQLDVLVISDVCDTYLDAECSENTVVRGIDGVDQAEEPVIGTSDSTGSLLLIGCHLLDISFDRCKFGTETGQTETSRILKM